MPSKYTALNDASRLAHASLTGESPNPEDQLHIPDAIREQANSTLQRGGVRVQELLHRIQQLPVEDQLEILQALIESIMPLPDPER